jgi:hypothetical protein
MATRSSFSFIAPRTLPRIHRAELHLKVVCRSRTPDGTGIGAFLSQILHKIYYAPKLSQLLTIVGLSFMLRCIIGFARAPSRLMLLSRDDLLKETL